MRSASTFLIYSTVKLPGGMVLPIKLRAFVNLKLSVRVDSIA